MSTRIAAVVAHPTVPQVLVARGLELLPLSVEERAERLDELPIGSAFAWQELLILAGYLRGYRIPQGKVLFHEGDRDAFLAVVLSGRLEIRKGALDESERAISTVTRGKLVGEMSLLDGGARSASALAAEDVELLILSRAEFESLVEAHPAVAIHLLVMLAQAIAQLLRQTTGALVEHLSAEAHGADETA
jgi:CRP-like cAMP-binding protein